MHKDTSWRYILIRWIKINNSVSSDRDLNLELHKTTHPLKSMGCLQILIQSERDFEHDNEHL